MYLFILSNFILVLKQLNRSEYIYIFLKIKKYAAVFPTNIHYIFQKIFFIQSYFKDNIIVKTIYIIRYR